MAGEAWRSLWQVGKEVTYGTPVAATRQLLPDPASSHITKQAAVRVVKVMTGTPDNVRGIKNRAISAGGNFSQTLDADEIIELLLGCVQGGVAGVQNGVTGQYNWTFKPSTTLDSQTHEWRDGSNDWQASGVYIDTLKVAWSAEAAGDAIVTATLFGKDRIINTLTGALATRSPQWIEGWETQLFIDALGAVPGTTPVGMAISGEVTMSRHLGRKYFATNTQATSSVPLGEFDVTGTVVYEANAAGLAEYNNWITTPTDRLLRLKFGNNGPVIGTSTVRKNMTVDIPCAYTAYDLSGMNATTRVMKATFQYKYDTTNAFSTAITCASPRAVAY